MHRSLLSVGESIVKHGLSGPEYFPGARLTGYELFTRRIDKPPGEILVVNVGHDELLLVTLQIPMGRFG